jgi:glutamyl-tRNA reductase
MNDKLKQTLSLPVNLLLAGRPCLVVGGGKIARRKAGHLADAGARITVVSPELCGEFAELSAEHVARPFEARDVDGMTLVFAATNDRYVNRQVLLACREKNILCSCVDGNWAHSDFTTPAIARHGDLTLAISSGGQSCRQSKLVKNSLARHLQMVESAELVVVGTDHRHLSLEEREPFHLTGTRLERTGFMIMQLWGVHEFIILNTCNRVEVIGVVSNETAHNGILRHIMGFPRLNESQFYIKHGADAFEHLCLVTSGMYSQTPGESHVAAQLKQALAMAQEAGWAGNMMQEWVSSFLHVSKHIQTDVAPLFRREEIEGLALKFLSAHLPDLAEKTLLVLGAGMIGQGLVRAAFPTVGKIIWCYHKNKPELSRDWKHVELCTFNSIKDKLGEADIIVSVTEAPGYVLHSGHAPFFDQEKKLTLIDLGMPRNIDPVLKELSDDLHLVDLDGLKHWHAHEAGEMEQLLTKSRTLIGEHLEQYERISRSFQSRHA